MSEVKDRREDTVNQLVMWAIRHGIDLNEAKNDFYMMLGNVEIMSRSTEIAATEENQNEYWLKKFLISKKVAGRTDRTIQFYARECTKALERIGKPVEKITADDIRYWMACRINKDKVSSITAYNEQRAFSSFLSWLYAEEVIRKNPMTKVEAVHKVKQKKEALTEMEIEKLREVAKGEKEKLIIEFLLSTGCRVTELTQIKISEIEENRVLVHGKGKKDRYVYLNARAKLMLEKYLNNRNDDNPYLFPRGKAGSSRYAKGKGSRKHPEDWWKNGKAIDEGHMDKASVEQLTRKLAKKAGVKKANPHKFRRTCATMALRRGMPIEQVSKMLGHENISTTQIYLDLQEEELAIAHKKYVI